MQCNPEVVGSRSRGIEISWDRDRIEIDRRTMPRLIGGRAGAAASSAEGAAERTPSLPRLAAAAFVRFLLDAAAFDRFFVDVAAVAVAFT